MSDLAKYRERLAEIAGVTAFNSSFEQYEPSTWVDSTGEHKGRWRPDEDVAQAIQCLEAMRPNWRATLAMFAGNQVWRVEIDGHRYFKTQENNLPAAIVSAIVAALGWAEPAQPTTTQA